LPDSVVTIDRIAKRQSARIRAAQCAPSWHPRWYRGPAVLRIDMTFVPASVHNYACPAETEGFPLLPHLALGVSRVGAGIGCRSRVPDRVG
jgi:hypothetical protein